MKMKSQHQFSQVPRADIARSSFNLSHGHKTTFDVDYLVPIVVMDIIPGDTFNLQCNFFMRLATPLHPIMDNMYAETFFFFVPYRLLWDNFEKFHGAQDNPGDTIDYTIPILSGNDTILDGSIGDYMGIPPGLLTNTTDVSALPFRAYRKIWNDWFRDENLQDSLSVPMGNGPDTGADAGYDEIPLIRGKRFDYFTSCLPSPQKGSAVSLPLGVSAPIATDSTTGQSIKITGDFSGTPFDGYIDTNGVSALMGANGGSNMLFADLSSATAATINDIRLAFQTQRLLERDARSGTRYVESLKAHWGVTSPDFRLQRAEFLGGGSSAVNITPVAQTSGQSLQVDADTLGMLAGFGTVSGTHSFSKSFVEHGVMIGIMNVRGDITYSQGLDRMWSKATRYDFFYPVLAQIGEQAVLNKEIFLSSDANDDMVFGYQERYAEYRYASSRLSGLMRVGIADTLDAWHLAEEFSSLPTLGSGFIQAYTADPLDRAVALGTEPHWIADFYFKIKAARPMPTYGVPGNMDRL